MERANFFIFLQYFYNKIKSTFTNNFILKCSRQNFEGFQLRRTLQKDSAENTEIESVKHKNIYSCEYKA